MSALIWYLIGVVYILGVFVTPAVISWFDRNSPFPATNTEKGMGALLWPLTIIAAVLANGAVCLGQGIAGAVAALGRLDVRKLWTATAKLWYNSQNKGADR